ncbi:hypothetical protein [Rhodanobacter thiooxydans]|uniref:hypothetical protein n=1 Tax=Rhodanobacter thiooxydans TaxID=416169 RepID=UPI00131F08BB|nr:hypothetical protein [Rhodanobacter thiooxydans]
MPVEEPSLSHAQIQAEVWKRLEKYKALNFFEQFAMFMGLAQAFEISLKQLLHRKYGVEFESLERTTLGQAAHQLKDRGLRPDFCALLDSVVSYRNHIAHSLLANQIMLQSLGVGDACFEHRELEKGIFELEQLWLLFEWTEKPNAWG